MPEMHLRQRRFMYSACGLFTENETRVRKFKETRDSRYIYRNELKKVCFQHDMVYGDFKDLPRRTVSDKILRGTVHIRAGIISDDQQLANELTSPSLENFRGVEYTRLIEITFGVWGADLADIQLISK